MIRLANMRSLNINGRPRRCGPARRSSTSAGFIVFRRNRLYSIKDRRAILEVGRRDYSSRSQGMSSGCAEPGDDVEACVVPERGWPSPTFVEDVRPRVNFGQSPSPASKPRSCESLPRVSRSGAQTVCFGLTVLG